MISIKPSVPQKRAPKSQGSLLKRLTELDFHVDNIKTILDCSNATPIRCQVGDRFACSFCLDQYQNLEELKTHSISHHSNDKPDFLNTRSLSKFIVYLDITSLRCSKCRKVFVNLEEFKQHLKENHEEVIHDKINNQVVPFIFVDGVLKCGVCEMAFKVLNDLEVHMAGHYKNFLCEFCDTPFVNRSKMREHKKIVHKV